MTTKAIYVEDEKSVQAFCLICSAGQPGDVFLTREEESEEFNTPIFCYDCHEFIGYYNLNDYIAQSESNN